MLNCKFCEKLSKNNNSLRNHERLCKLNSNKQTTYFETHKNVISEMRKTGRIEYTNQYSKAKKLGLPKPTVSEETRKKISEATTKRNKNRPKEEITKISESMKKAHREGRAWNIGKSRWNNAPSYPESFFMKVIENEFQDKNYIREFPVYIYSLDFAWLHKKKCIEIDGDQHQRFEDYKERDKRKDQYLTEQGWEVLRIVWKEMFNDTKFYIELTKKFIDN